MKKKIFFAVLFGLLGAAQADVVNLTPGGSTTIENTTVYCTSAGGGHIPNLEGGYWDHYGTGCKIYNQTGRKALVGCRGDFGHPVRIENRQIIFEDSWCGTNGYGDIVGTEIHWHGNSCEGSIWHKE